MFLKVFITVCVVAGVVLMAAWPWLLGPRPGAGSPPPEIARWGVKALVYFGLTCLTWLSAAMGSMLLVRQVKKEILDSEKENLKALVEGSLKDHDRTP